MPDYLKYQKSISQELLSIKDRVRYFIDDHHWGEDGRYKEILLRDCIRQKLPQNAKIGTGFVIGSDNTITSQIDIIIYRSEIPTLFQKEDFVILPKEAVLGVIEVKTKLNSTNITETFKKSHNNGIIIGTRIFNGIFSYEKGFCFCQHIPNSVRENCLQYAGYTGLIQCWADGCVIDNLCLMYSNTMAVATGNNKSITVQNCEVGFIGGGSHLVGMNSYVPVSGEGIRLDGYGNSARNNYVHDCFDGGIILEPDLQFELDDGEISDEMRAVRWGNTTIEGNVIHRCNSGILIGVHCEDSITAYVEGITIRNNDILYSGYGWSGDPHYDFTWGDSKYIGNAITFWDDDYEHGTFLVENNRLYVAKASLIHMRLKEENAPLFSGNTYAQNHNGYLLDTQDERVSRAYSTGQALQKCEDVLGDSNAIVILFAK